MNKCFWIFLLFFFILPLLAPVSARQPIMESRAIQGTSKSDPYTLYESAHPLGDPTFASYAVYGALGAGDVIDVYTFTSKKEEIIPVELLVPKAKFTNFRPTLIIIGKYLSGDNIPSAIPVPVSFGAITIPSPETRTSWYEPWSLTTFYRGKSQDIHVLPDAPYFLAVFDPNGLGGQYVINVGYKENYSSSVKDTAIPVDINVITFENVAVKSVSRFSQAEKVFFQEEKTPFQTFDSKLRLWVDLLFFYFNRILALVAS